VHHPCPGGSFQDLQRLTTLLGQQVAKLTKLAETISRMCPVSGPFSAIELSLVVRAAHAMEFVQDQGIFVLDSIPIIGADEVASIKRGIAGLFAGLYDGITTVVATRNSNNEADETGFPPVAPHSLVKFRTFHISVLIRQHRDRLDLAGWTEDDITQIEADHRDLREEYMRGEELTRSLDLCSDEKTGFDEGWGLVEGRFGTLKRFCGGLATVFPNTATVEFL